MDPANSLIVRNSFNIPLFNAIRRLAASQQTHTHTHSHSNSLIHSHAYSRVAESISRFPFKIRSAADAKLLIGVGEFIANQIEAIIKTLPQGENHQAINNQQQKQQQQRHDPSSADAEAVNYRPKVGSVPYSFLLALNSLASTQPHSPPQPLKQIIERSLSLHRHFLSPALLSSRVDLERKFSEAGMKLLEVKFIEKSTETPPVRYRLASGGRRAAQEIERRENEKKQKISTADNEKKRKPENKLDDYFQSGNRIRIQQKQNNESQNPHRTPFIGSVNSSISSSESDSDFDPLPRKRKRMNSHDSSITIPAAGADKSSEINLLSPETKKIGNPKKPKFNCAADSSLSDSSSNSVSIHTSCVSSMPIHDSVHSSAFDCNLFSAPVSATEFSFLTNFPVSAAQSSIDKQIKAKTFSQAENKVSRVKSASESETEPESEAEADGKPESDSLSESAINSSKRIKSMNSTNSLNPGFSPSLISTPSHLPYSEFSLYLLVDNRERRGVKDRVSLCSLLSARGLPCESRSLPLGDFQWILRHRIHTELEFILDCLLERKKVSDFCSSIVSGRYSEQRVRMKLSGINRLAFVIEGSLTTNYFQRLPIPLSTVQSALAALSSIHGFFVFHSLTLDDSLDLLAHLHSEIESFYKTKLIPINNSHSATRSNSAAATELIGEFELFSSWSDRVKRTNSSRVSQQFGLQLRQIRGISAPIARSIISRHSSARLLFDCLSSLSGFDDEVRYLAAIEVSRDSSTGKTRKIGNAIAMRIRQFFRGEQYENEEKQFQQTKTKQRKPTQQKTKTTAKKKDNNNSEEISLGNASKTQTNNKTKKTNTAHASASAAVSSSSSAPVSALSDRSSIDFLLSSLDDYQTQFETANNRQWNDDNQEESDEVDNHDGSGLDFLRD